MGPVIVGTGGVLLTLIVTVRLSERPPLSVTRRRATNVPGDVYVKDGFAVDTSSVPLPSKSHAYVSGPALGVRRAAAGELRP